VGFVGRSSTWRTLLEVTFPEHLVLKYLNNYLDCLDNDLIIAERYIASLLGGCGNVRTVDGTMSSTVRELLMGLPVNNVVLGIDAGGSRSGVTILVDDSPIIHLTMSLSNLHHLVDSISSLNPTLVLGSSPGVRSMVSQLLGKASRLGLRVVLVDEGVLSYRRSWFRRRYPHLSLDELDSLIYAQAYGEFELVSGLA